MFPISIMQQKTTSKSQLFAPKVKDIQNKYRNNNAKMQEEMAKLQKQGYNPAGGCFPMIATMLILFGVLGVVYKPMTYFEQIPEGQIAIAEEIAIDIEYTAFLDEDAEKPEDERASDSDKERFMKNLITRYGALQGELRVVSAYMEEPERFKEPVKISDETIAMFKELDKKRAESGSLNADSLEKLDKIEDNIFFMGINFSQIPNFTWPLILIPILSFLFAVAHMVVTQMQQRKVSPESVQQMGSMKYMLYFMPVMSLVIAFQFPAGAGFYWALSSLVGILQSLIIFKIWPPDKLREEVKATLEKKGYNIDNVVVIEKSDGQTATKKESEMSSSEKKEYYRKKLEEARKADLEKYGEVGKSPVKESEKESEKESGGEK